MSRYGANQLQDNFSLKFARNVQNCRQLLTARKLQDELYTRGENPLRICIQVVERWMLESHTWYGIARVDPHPNALSILAMPIVSAAIVPRMRLDRQNNLMNMVTNSDFGNGPLVRCCSKRSASWSSSSCRCGNDHSCCWSYQTKSRGVIVTSGVYNSQGQTGHCRVSTTVHPISKYTV